jgi:hypothetical protein
VRGSPRGSRSFQVLAATTLGLPSAYRIDSLSKEDAKLILKTVIGRTAINVGPQVEGAMRELEEQMRASFDRELATTLHSINFGRRASVEGERRETPRWPRSNVVRHWIQDSRPERAKLN